MSHTDEQMEQQIQEKGLTAPRVTLDQIKEMMKRVQYKFDQPEGTTSTFAHAFLDGEFFLASGYSACVSKENFDAELGREYAQANAEKHAQDKLWELEGYNLYRNPMMECSKACGESPIRLVELKEPFDHLKYEQDLIDAHNKLQPWEKIPTLKILPLIGPVTFDFKEAVTSDQFDYWQCVITVNILGEGDTPSPQIIMNGITEVVAFDSAISMLKEMAYKNEWVLG